MLSPQIVVVIIEFYRNDVRNRERNENYLKIVEISSLYEEFYLSAGISSIHFYSVFIVKCMIFIFSKIILDSNYVEQFSVHTICSLICLVYYAKFVNMNDKKDKAVLMASEFVILLTFFSILIINFIQSEFWLDIISHAVVFSLFGFITIEVLVELFKVVEGFKNYFAKLKIQVKNNNVSGMMT